MALYSVHASPLFIIVFICGKTLLIIPLYAPFIVAACHPLFIIAHICVKTLLIIPLYAPFIVAVCHPLFIIVFICGQSPPYTSILVPLYPQVSIVFICDVLKQSM